MCDDFKTIAKNNFGQLNYCLCCNVYHLTFNNIFLEFNEKEMERFKEYISSVDFEYWDAKYNKVVLNRKIPIQTMQQNLALVFNKQEINALKSLIMQTTKKPFSSLKVLDIDYLFYLN